MIPIHIRSATQRDVPILSDLIGQLHAYHQSTSMPAPSQDEAASQLLVDYLHDPNTMIYLAITDEQKIIGVITGHFSELSSPVMPTQLTGSINELFVLPEYRHQQVGQRLFSYLEERFIEYGVEQLLVEVWAFNHSARAFYHELGLQPHVDCLRKSLKVNHDN